MGNDIKGIHEEENRYVADIENDRMFKADGQGIRYRKPTGFGYGKAESIKWEQVEAIIAGDQIFSIDENLGVISENKLNAQALS